MSSKCADGVLVHFYVWWSYFFQWKNYPMMLQIFWLEDDLATDVKRDILNNIVVPELSKREHYYKADAKVTY